MLDEEGAIADLRARMKRVEDDMADIRDNLGAYQEDRIVAAGDKERVNGELRRLSEAVETLVKKGPRRVDVLISIGVLLAGGVSAFTAIQMVQLTKIMIPLQALAK